LCVFYYTAETPPGLVSCLGRNITVKGQGTHSLQLRRFSLVLCLCLCQTRHEASFNYCSRSVPCSSAR